MNIKIERQLNTRWQHSHQCNIHMSRLLLFNEISFSWSKANIIAHNMMDKKKQNLQRKENISQQNAIQFQSISLTVFGQQLNHLYDVVVWICVHTSII